MRIYFYPRTTKGSKDTQNPYTLNFLNTLQSNHEVLNLKDPSPVGLLKVFKYLGRIDLLILNWIEDLPDKKGGFLQTLVFLFLVYYLKIRRKKILWILHNKLSHYKTHVWLKKRLFKFILRKATVIYTHANDGISFAKSFYPKVNLPIFFFPHPTIPYKVQSVLPKKNDILIWGAITEYKGIDRFLKFLHEEKIEKQYKILIAGKVRDTQYKKLLESLCTENIQLHDSFIERDELIKNIRESKMTLFTYSDDSVLSSGALVDTLTLGGNILGPNNGSFKDMAQENLIQTYNNFNEIPVLINQVLNNPDTVTYNQNLERYLNNTSWEKFITAIDNRINL